MVSYQITIVYKADNYYYCRCIILCFHHSERKRERRERRGREGQTGGGVRWREKVGERRRVKGESNIIVPHSLILTIPPYSQPLKPIVNL